MIRKTKGSKRKKTPKLSPLAKRKKNPNSTYWREATDKIFSRIVRLRDRECMICGKKGRPLQNGEPIGGLDAHHIISRSQLQHRYNLSNCIALCKACHKFGHKGISPHSSLEAIEQFWQWLSRSPKMKEHYTFYKTHTFNKVVKITYHEQYNQLKLVESSQLKELKNYT